MTEDATIRYFTATPAPPLPQVRQSHGEHIGNDVTVLLQAKHATAQPADR